MEITELLDALQTIGLLVLPVIGVTGGLKGLIGELKPIGWKGLTIPGGLWFSWLVALAWVGGRVVLGIDAPAPDADAADWIAGRWAFVAMTSNVIRNWIRGAAPMGLRRA